MKRCPKCLQEKEFSHFGKDKQKKDGLNSHCKECIRERNRKTQATTEFKEYARKYRLENKDILREQYREYFHVNREKCAEHGKKSYLKHRDEIAKRRKAKRCSPEGRKKERIRQTLWRQKNKEKFRKTIRTWQINNREKTNAHAKVHRAVENGKLMRSKSCEECDMKCKTEGHHEDYMKPLDVVWLCRLCHAKKIEMVEV